MDYFNLLFIFLFLGQQHDAAYLYDLARLGQNDLHGSELLHFMKQSAELAADLASTKFDTGGEI